MQIGKCGPALRNGPAEYFLNHGENHHGGDEQSQHDYRCAHPRQRKDAAEDEELADKSVESGQTERREQRDAHESRQDRCGLAQTAEVVDAAQTAGAELDHGDEPEERGRRDSVVEHLQDDAVQRRSLAGLLCCAGCRNRQREDAEQAVAQVIDRGVREDALQIRLRGRGPRAHDDSGGSKNKQRRAHGGNLRTEDRNGDAQQAVDAHLRHRAGKQHGHRRRRLSVRGGQPRVERHERHFDREAGEHADGEPRHHRTEMRGHHLRELAGCSHLRELAKVHGAGRVFTRGREEDGEERKQERHRAGHGVDEELRGRRTALRAAPQLDEEECGDEAQFPEQKPVEEIERGEGAEESRLKREHQAEEEAGHVVHAMRRHRPPSA